MNQDLEITEGEIIEAYTNYSVQGKKILSRAFGLSKEILEIPDDNSKGSELRRKCALKLVGDLINYYEIPEAKGLFLKSIKSKNKDEQISALEGLENYYDVTEEEIDNDLRKILEEIIKTTDRIDIVSTCLQIQINAGKIDEMTELDEIDDWKEEYE